MADDKITVERLARAPRHVDPGDTFKPNPAPRPAQPRLAAPIGQVQLGVPAGNVGQIEVRYRFAEGDWTEWKVARAAFMRFPLAAVAGEWRLSGAADPARVEF